MTRHQHVYCSMSWWLVNSLFAVQFNQSLPWQMYTTQRHHITSLCHSRDQITADWDECSHRLLSQLTAKTLLLSLPTMHIPQSWVMSCMAHADNWNDSSVQSLPHRHIKEELPLLRKMLPHQQRGPDTVVSLRQTFLGIEQHSSQLVNHFHSLLTAHVENYQSNSHTRTHILAVPTQLCSRMTWLLLTVSKTGRRISSFFRQMSLTEWNIKAIKSLV